MSIGNQHRFAATIVALAVVGATLTACGGDTKNGSEGNPVTSNSVTTPSSMASASSPMAGATSRTELGSTTEFLTAPAGPTMDIGPALNETCANEIAKFLADPKPQMRPNGCSVTDMQTANGGTLANSVGISILLTEYEKKGVSVTDLPVPATLLTTDGIRLEFKTGVVKGTRAETVSISYYDVIGKKDKARATAVVHKVAEILIAKAMSK